MAEERWMVTGPQTIDVDGVTSLKLGIVSGRFDIVTHEEPVTRIEVSEVAGDPVDIAFTAGRLEIRHQEPGPQGWFKNVMNSVTRSHENHVVLSIAVPAGIQVDASTVAGDGLVSGTTSKTSLNTVSGAVVADRTASHLDVNSVSGEAVIREHRGSLSVNTVSGAVTATGRLNHVRLNNVSGEILLDVSQDTQDIGANTVSGDVTVRLPRECGVDLTAKTGSGQVVIDTRRYMPVKNTVKTITGPEEHLVVLRTNSVSGNISVVHAADNGQEAH
ncbi:MULTISPECIES: DUF4097 family beta strand repeat-containing protein [Arthrobacter]|uniref:DUF4097 family beta strand repeat-containing protein n=2 Tax=Arthrobacter TaxID=1663 RepID=A0ABU9KJI3_9MICC|nr:DUF4097 family beta strand repeat-containing protein [Arthrobacter sp. YJM1]MDP5227284.1 DUF4097 family beta strand repeat-containing protein [Arthrobacter sp. YJM1]